MDNCYIQKTTKIGIYIGSFNPVHIGHIDIVNYLINNKILDKVVIVPTLGYWNKDNLIDIKHRINMLKFFESENIKIDKEHNKLIYTYELLKELNKKYKNDELHLILGADNIINLDKWKNYEELLKYKIIIINRNNINLMKYIKKYKTNNFIILENYKNIDISSTEIRNNLNNKYLHKKVYNYIIKNNLYKNI